MTFYAGCTAVTSQKPFITDLSLQQLQQALQHMKEPSFRYKQVLNWIYQKRVSCFDDMRNVASATRQKLQDLFCLQKLTVKYLLESKQGDAVKFGFTVGEEDAVIESVLLYDGKRRSLCISSQMGCKLGCVFCETGKMGFVRNLSLHEITGQLIGANDYLAAHTDKPVTNIIFMGMGEALDNFETFLCALEIIRLESCFDLAGRRVTVSTAGVIPHIERLMEMRLPVKLAISLNASSNAKRSAIMPVNKRYPIEDLVKISREYYNKTGNLVTFEYVLIHDETDTDQDMHELVKLLKGLPCKINLIPINPYTDTTRSAPSPQDIDRFVEPLADRGIYVTVRKSRGQDICGACGQLASRK